MRKSTTVRSFAIPFLAMALSGCGSGRGVDRDKPVVLRFIGGGPLTLRELGMRQESFDKFTKQTGIRVIFIPGPESSTARLKLYQETFGQKSSNPDVYQVDVIWPGILAENSTDLRPYLGEEAKESLPAEVQNDTVDGRLVALPFSVERGVLYYRTDLLKKYGYSHPPETWDELEEMANRIQAGERKAGNKDFWGYVWQGAAYEGLTCNALEWQASQGGGRIIEEDRTISVNNPRTVQAMERARSWVGTISPPGVTEYQEEDARNAFLAGSVAFRRDWAWTENVSRSAEHTPVNGKVSVTRLPRGEGGHATTIGGWSLAVSKYSAHPREGAELIRYMTSRDAAKELMPEDQRLSARRDFYEDPLSFQSQPDLAHIRDIFLTGAIARPSTVTGKRYAEVSNAYFTAVHRILTGEETAEKALGELEATLVKITGYAAKEPERKSARP